MVLELFTDTNFCENGQELRKSRNLIPGEFNIFKVIKALFQKNVVLSITL